MCKTCKTRSGHPSGGAGHGAAGGTSGTGGGRRGSTHIYYAEGQGHRLRRRAKSGLALRRASNLKKHGVLGDGIEFGLVDHHAARASRRHLIYGESHRLNASKSGLFRVQCKMNFSREGAAE